MKSHHTAFKTPQAIGTISLIGAGPGDPELLTLKAAKHIEQAQVIVFDYLVSPAIRQLFPAHAVRHCVGKAKGKPSTSQADINQLLLDYARDGMNVCRVKGGDSFIFGRGSEEMLFLAQHGIPVEVIPGITAASGCCSATHLPLTHRGLAQGCTMLTAHGEKDLAIHWPALVALNHTLVIYMGLSKCHEISQQLQGAGMNANTPVAIIEQGCTPQQRVHYGQLSTLSQLKAQHQIRSPALIVIGPVVQIAEQMQTLIAQSVPVESISPVTPNAPAAPLPLSA